MRPRGTRTPLSGVRPRENQLAGARYAAKATSAPAGSVVIAAGRETFSQSCLSCGSSGTSPAPVAPAETLRHSPRESRAVESRARRRYAPNVRARLTHAIASRREPSRATTNSAVTVAAGRRTSARRLGFGADFAPGFPSRGRRRDRRRSQTGRLGISRGIGARCARAPARFLESRPRDREARASTTRPGSRVCCSP